MFTTSERKQFESRGLVKLKKFLPADKVYRAQMFLLQHLEREGIWRHGAWYLDEQPMSTAIDAGMHLVRPLKRDQTFIDLATDEAPSAASALVDGRPLLPMVPHPTILFTLPNATKWELPYKTWHLDAPRLAENGIPGVQIFTFLNKVEPSGGGTLAVEGSHHLLNEDKRISSKEVKQRLMEEPYFGELMSNKAADRQRFMREPGYVGDTKLQVVEMVGEPGDVYFMDLRILHNIGPNSLTVPRIMLTQRYFLESARKAISNS